ncbi:MAG TPA: EAL domain-containing protein [Microthrixaceae bacterium]|nr:EAL domain-containing protein [Microthrixaceae bacterium]
MRTKHLASDSEVISPTAAGRIAGVALLFGAITNGITAATSPSGAKFVTIGLWLSVVIFAIAILSFIAPWNKMGPRSTLVLVPAVFVLLAVGNYWDPLPYVAGIYFVLLGAWVGLCHPRYTTLALTPVFALVFWAPLAVNPHLPRLSASAVVVTLVSVAIGEILGTLRVNLERSRLELARSAKRRFAALTRNSVDVTFIFGFDNSIWYVSPAVTARFGYEPNELESMPLKDFLSNIIDGIDTETIDSLISGDYREESVTEAHELRLRHADGTWIDVEATAQNLLDDPDIGGIIVHIRDVRSRKSLESDLHHRAFHDDLTGLPNRAAFRQEIHRAKGEGGPVSVVFVDLDGFKNVNDTSGHQQGDRLLRLVAERLSAAVPERSIVARLGGDEFAVLLPFGLDRAVQLAEGLVELISEPFALTGSVVSVGASAGVAEADNKQSDDQVIGDADMAMYEAKVSPTSSVAAFEPQMRTRLLERLDSKARLQLAIDREEFVLHFQPELDLRTGSWIGAEALLRWNRPGTGLVPPAEFIGIAEESGIIVEIGRWILREACREAATWPELGGGKLSVSVNVSARQFQDSELLADVAFALCSTGLPPERLIIEVTESMLIDDIEVAEVRLRSLREMGIRLALDDFGTGYSSLSYLQALPFDILKIDRSFVENATTELRDLSLLQTINRLGHDLGLQTLIEGVETDEQAKLVKSVGCDLSQGYYFAKPMAPEQLRAEYFCRDEPMAKAG